MEYIIDAVDIKGKIEVYEMIELIGILLDNAVEALCGSSDKKIVLKLVETEKGIKSAHDKSTVATKANVIIEFISFLNTFLTSLRLSVVHKDKKTKNTA